MDEAKIRSIVQDEISKNYRNGDPQVAPHSHNGNDGLSVGISNLLGVTPLRQMKGNFPVPDAQDSSGTGRFELGFLAQLTPADLTSPAQYLANPEVEVLTAIPVVQGNGVGAQSSFNGGNAPNGTMVLFANGPTLSILYIRLNGEWYAINVDSVI